MIAPALTPALVPALCLLNPRAANGRCAALAEPLREALPQVPLAVDGEPLPSATDITVHVRPAALSVVR